MTGADFSERQLHRYARHIVLPEVGGAGQARLLAAKVLIVGAGGLGSPLLLYLAAAGVGTLGVVDGDRVELSNLQRQVVHSDRTIGMAKTESAAAAVGALNPDVAVIRHDRHLAYDNAQAIVSGYDLVCDGTDNFRARYLINDACFLAGKPLVSAAVTRFDGQLTTFRAFEPGRPCYRCLFPEAPPEGLLPSCSEAGIFGAIAGVMGTLQAAETLKELLGLGESLAGTLLVYDALAGGFHRVAYGREEDCALCGRAPSIADLSGHAPAPGGGERPALAAVPA